MTEYQALVPNYYDVFSCLGSDCVYTCCQLWRIDISKADYKKIMNAKMPADIRQKLRSTFQRKPEEEVAENRYAQIIKGEHGRCPLLDEQGLCMIHKHCGPEYLPAICRNFPRVNNLTNDIIERHIRLPCESIILQLMRLEEGIQFETKTIKLGKVGGYYHLNSQFTQNNPLMKEYWNIKTLMIAVLQCGEYPIADRILYIGLILKRLIALEEEGRASEAGDVVRALMQQDDKAVWQSIAALPADPTTCMHEMVDLCKTPGEPYFEALCLRMIERLGEVNAKEKIAHIDVQRYLADKQEFETFMKAYPRTMENIAVALFHECLQPFGGVNDAVHQECCTEHVDLWLNYLFYCRQFATTQFMMRVITELHTTEHEFATAVAIIFRGYTGAVPSLSFYANKLREKKLDTLDALSVLLKG